MCGNILKNELHGKIEATFIDEQVPHPKPAEASGNVINCQGNS
jgi:hypothetical protein